MIDLSYPAILTLFPQYLDPQRYESASFLMWYLEKYYLLDEKEAVDCVCDKSGDKGIDGIFVNDDTKTITLFQSVICKTDRTIGDGDKLTGFAGKFNHFKNADSVRNLLSSAGDAEIASLIDRLDIVNKVDTYEVVGEFVTNVELDSNGESFLNSAQHITFVGRSTLQQTFISNSREILPRAPITFHVSGFGTTEYHPGGETPPSVVSLVSARELVAMDGIANQSLFAYNVRGPLGKTSVNRAIAKTIQDATKHKYFPLFHNGITVIAKEFASKTTSWSTDAKASTLCMRIAQRLRQTSECSPSSSILIRRHN